MTIVFTGATEKFIVMTTDSAVTNEFDAIREYTTGQKLYIFQGKGCVATWGSRNGNNIGMYLKGKAAPDDGLGVTDLAHLVLKYLTDEYQADNPVSDDIGFHVAGFNGQRNPCLYHIYWGVPRPNPNNQGQSYDISDHSPSPRIPIQLVYNGRNDIANSSIQTLIQEIGRKRDIRFDITTPVGMAQFGDMLVRFAAEITPEVGPPFQTAIVSPDNKILYIKNEQWSPIDDAMLSEQIKGLGVTSAEITLSTLRSASTDFVSLTDSPALPSGIKLTEEELKNYRHGSRGTATPFIIEKEDLDNNT